MFGEDGLYEEVNYKALREYRETLWKTSFGLQKIDRLKPSDYLIELSKEEIEGNKTYAEIRDSLDKYYSSEESNKETEEADKVSVSIAERLSQPRLFEKSTRGFYLHLCLHHHSQEIAELSSVPQAFPFEYTVSLEWLHDSDLFTLSNFGGKIVLTVD